MGGLDAESGGLGIVLQVGEFLRPVVARDKRSWLIY